MRIEHIALQVKDPVAVAAWYIRHLGFRLARLAGGPAQTHFLADGAGCVVLELYNNPAAPQPDYAAMDPLLLHVAFAVEDVEAVYHRLVGAGALAVAEPTAQPSGDILAMLRDPFGLAIQLARRATPLVG